MKTQILTKEKEIDDLFKICRALANNWRKELDCLELSNRTELNIYEIQAYLIRYEDVLNLWYYFPKKDNKKYVLGLAGSRDLLSHSYLLGEDVKELITQTLNNSDDLNYNGGGTTK